MEHKVFVPPINHSICTQELCTSEISLGWEFSWKQVLSHKAKGRKATAADSQCYLILLKDETNIILCKEKKLNCDIIMA